MRRGFSPTKKVDEKKAASAPGSRSTDEEALPESSARKAEPSQPAPSSLASTQPDPFAHLAAAAEWFYTQASHIYAVPAQSAYGERVRTAAAAFARSIAPNQPALTLSEATALLAWIALESLPPAVNKPAFFDDLRLRAVIAHAVSDAGAPGEDSWRAAARIRLALLPSTPLLDRLRSDHFWNEPDVPFLAGISESEGIRYVDQKRFESLIEWLHLTGPAGSSTPTEIAALAATAGYKIPEIKKLAGVSPQHGNDHANQESVIVGEIPSKTR